MRSFAKTLIVSAFVVVASAWSNTPPIPDRNPGLGEGSGNLGITFELHYDLMCSASAALHPSLKEFLDMPFMDGKARDAVKVTYTF